MDTKSTKPYGGATNTGSRPTNERGGVEPVGIDPLRPEMELAERLEVRRPPFASGGSSDICEAYDRNLLRTVAHKSLLAEIAVYETVCARIVEEAQITAQLDHPNIVPVHELGVNEKGQPFFTMKLVRGRTLAELMGKARAERAGDKALFSHMQVFLKVLDAVSFAHSRGIIHRDIKPDNIMVGDYGEVYLMDWGIARSKHQARPSERDREMPDAAGRPRYLEPDETSAIYATACYMAPEQARCDIQAIDERTDVFCLGAILYEILTGSPPNIGETIEEVIINAANGAITPPSELVGEGIPPRLGRITMKALSKDQSERFQSALEMRREVEGFMKSGWQYPRKTFPAGSLIVREGEPGDTAYIIVSGRCRVFKTLEGRDLELGEMNYEDVFGEVSVFTGEPRSASVQAIDEVTAMVLTRKDFEEDLGMSFWLGLFVKALAERFKKKEERLIEIEERLKKAGLSIERP